MRTRTLIGGVVAAIFALPASAQAASLSVPGPFLGDMSATATTVTASRTPSIRLDRAGSADLVIGAIDRDGRRFTVVVAAFNRSPGGGSGSTRITISGRGVKLSRTLTAGNVLFGQPSRCTDSEAIAYEETDTGRFVQLKGRVPALPPKVGKPARLVKYAVDEMCGASYQQHGFLTHFAWNVGPTTALPVTANSATVTWERGATSGSICANVVTNPPQPGVSVRATVVPVRGRSFSGTGTIGADGTAKIPIGVGLPGTYDLQIALGGTPVGAGFLLTLPGPAEGQPALQCG
jgi:hypothetical protein